MDAARSEILKYQSQKD